MDNSFTVSANNKLTILFTGGAGFLGKSFIRQYKDKYNIIVYSRDEAKHYLLKKEYPTVKFIVGDIRDYESLLAACELADIGVFAASIKQIETCESFPQEAVKTIINGALNSKKAALNSRRMKKGIFISSDKACAATTIYGAAKYVAEQSFITGDDVDNSEKQFISLRYGNVLNSTGSIIPVLKNAIEKNLTVKLYHPMMTRFVITAQEACDMINYFVEAENKIANICAVPRLFSFRVVDLFDIFVDYGLKYEMASPRRGEKIHELMISEEEMPRAADNKKYIFIHKSESDIEKSLLDYKFKEYSSKDDPLTKAALKKILKDNGLI